MATVNPQAEGLYPFDRCIADGCRRKPDVVVRCRHGAVYYCRRHAHRWCMAEYVTQPATAVVLAGRFWDADRKNGAKRRKQGGAS
jgi:hypothetical protein